MTVIKDT